MILCALGGRGQRYPPLTPFPLVCNQSIKAISIFSPPPSPFQTLDPTLHMNKGYSFVTVFMVKIMTSISIVLKFGDQQAGGGPESNHFDLVTVPCASYEYYRFKDLNLKTSFSKSLKRFHLEPFSKSLSSFPKKVCCQKRSSARKFWGQESSWRLRWCTVNLKRFFFNMCGYIVASLWLLSWVDAWKIPALRNFASVEPPLCDWP